MSIPSIFSTREDVKIGLSFRVDDKEGRLGRHRTLSCEGKVLREVS